jgi:cytochrome c553
MIRAVVLALLGVALPAIGATGGAAKPDLAKGREIANQVCAACHAGDGNSSVPANPKLAGQFSEYLEKQLTNFKPEGGKKAERESPVMGGMVANLSPKDMRDVAAYFASQKLKPETAKDKTLALQGEKIYRGGNLATGVAACAGCHGPAGAGIPSEFPRIAGQFSAYVEAQLKAFKAGARGNDPNAMMRTIARRMSDDEIKAVAEYVSGLR